MKPCIICEVTQPLTEYYVHKQMGDGHLNKCKTCCKKQAKAREEELRQDPNWVESEKIRARDKYNRLYVGKAIDPDYKRKIMSDYKSKYPEKQKAKNATQRMERGHKMELHHWSYNEEHYRCVIELNNKDHRKLHRYMTYDQERMMYRTTQGVLLDTKKRHLEYFHSLADMP